MTELEEGGKKGNVQKCPEGDKLDAGRRTNDNKSYSRYYYWYSQRELYNYPSDCILKEYVSGSAATGDSSFDKSVGIPKNNK